MEVQYSKQAVLSLYRMLLRKGRTLQYTDKEFYFRRVRAEFEKNSDVTEKHQQVFLLKKGHQFLKKDALV